MDARGRIELLGGLRVRMPGGAGSGEPCIHRFVTRKFADLLAYLAFYRERAHLREGLVALLWPESAPAAGRRHLRVALTSLRHQLEPPDAGSVAGGAFLGTRTTVQLNPAAWITDVALFEAACRQAEGARDPAAAARLLERAVELYGGELLPGCSDEWVLPERQHLMEQYLRSLGRLATLREQAGDLPGALPYARRAVAVDPLREEACFELIRLLLAAGEPGLARQAYQELEQRLRQELDTTPSLELRALIEEAHCRAGTERADFPLRGLRQQAPGETPRENVPPADAAADTDGSLPLSFTRFFGREAEIAELVKALGSRLSAVGEDALAITEGRQPTAGGPRLITLTGPGGIGKTRLALEVAARLWGPLREGAPPRRGGPWFVPLAGLAPSALPDDAAGAGGRIVDQLLEVLRLPRSPQVDPVSQVVSFLCPQPSLLVLDNFEHLVEGGALLVRQLLERVPALTVLVTSRRRLDLEAERELPLAPLPVPGVQGECVFRSSYPAKPTAGSSLSDTDYARRNTSECPNALSQCPSVRLFLDRAQAVRPDFRLTATNAAAVASLCARLEGIPLALELAAARVWMLTPAQMLERLPAARLDLLASRRRDLNRRHRSLRATLEWSYQLLPPELQRLFARLSVFAGGWTLEAAEAVCGDVGVGCWVFGVGEAAPGRTPNTQHPTPTWDALEQLREASLILVETTPAAEESRCRMLETLREYAGERLAPEERAAVAYRHAKYYLALAERDDSDPRLEKQQERSARLERERDNLRAALDGCVKAVDSGQWLVVRAGTAGLGLTTHHPPPSAALEIGFCLARALLKIWHSRGHLGEGRRWLSALLAHPQAAALPAARARALTDAGYLAFMQGDAAAAGPLLEESVALFRELGDRSGIALSLNNLALVAADPAAQALLYERSLALFRELADEDRIANALFNLATVAQAQGERARARSLAAESRASYRAQGNKGGVAMVTMLQAEMAVESDYREEGRRLLEEALGRFRDVGNRLRMRECLSLLARVARAEGNAECARAYFTEALDLSRELGHRPGIADVLQELAELELDYGDGRAAHRLLEEALAQCREIGNEIEAAACREKLEAIEARILPSDRVPRSS